MKDFDPALPVGTDPSKYPIPEQAQLVEPGAGAMDFAAIVKTLNEYGICHRFVEIDVAANPKQSIERGYDYLANLE
jgi:sugar phosphate isomerase/epimerase